MGPSRCTNATVTTKHEQPFIFAIGERFVTAGHTVGLKVCLLKLIRHNLHTPKYSSLSIVIMGRLISWDYDSEFPALGPQGPTQAAQVWNRISTQSPSQGRPTAEDLFQGHLGGAGGLDDFRLPTHQQQQSSLMHPNSLDEFPALPRAQNGQHLDLTQPEGQQQARNAFMSGGMGGLVGQQQQNQQAQARQQQQQSAALRQSVLSPPNMQNGRQHYYPRAPGGSNSGTGGVANKVTLSVGAPSQTSRLLPNDMMLQQQAQSQQVQQQTNLSNSIAEQDKKQV